MSKFSVMDMVDELSSSNNIDPNEIFKKEETNEKQNIVEKPVVEENKPKQRDWNPDESLLDDLPELKNHSGVVYDKSEIKTFADNELKNIADEMAKKEAVQAMDELSRKEFNIEELKKRRGYLKLQIPPGEIQTKILIAASDPNYDIAQKKLDELFNEIEKTYPSFILERDTSKIKIDKPEENEPQIDVENSISQDIKQDIKNEEANYVKQVEVKEEDIITNDDVTTVIIDKRNASQLSWNEDEVKKIKKSRQIQLNIVETENINISEIEEIDSNMVDVVLQQYQRKTNDIVTALPGSKYRVTLSGLTYPEVIDLSTSQEMNNIDGEWKKWSICFNHIKNPSIGAFEEYYLYKQNGKSYKVYKVEDVPENIQSHKVTKFEDFLRKTSFVDLEYMLWRILCATTRNEELISIDCHAIQQNGSECGNTYDWIYSPESLLLVDSIPNTILEEMKETGEVSSQEDIFKCFKSSPVNTNATVELLDSGFLINMGHVSAYEYLTNIYPMIKSLENEENSNDPTLLSKGMAYSTLVVIKSLLIPQPNGKYLKVSKAEDIVKFLSQLNEVDWQTISEISKMSLEPYQFKYSLKDIVCPKCKNRSSIEIEDMSKLVFILALSLSSVQVTLKKD